MSNGRLKIRIDSKNKHKSALGICALVISNKITVNNGIIFFIFSLGFKLRQDSTIVRIIIFKCLNMSKSKIQPLILISNKAVGLQLCQTGNLI
jgi:hypothetical protein